MKIIGITLASLILAGVIISPFFWLSFLRIKNVFSYLVASSIVTILFLLGYIFFVYNYLKNLIAKVNTNLYYYFYDSFDYASYIVIFLIIISPLIFVRILWKRFTLQSFLLAMFLSVIFLGAIFLFWALVLLPQAFSQLHNYF